ncbi:MAG: copper amine oxidase N-terminal domain-containing protein [Eubacterium sp.]|nr:copper amine oxidase N-terminal domain-containing protein [Eubacterium sp.]
MESIRMYTSANNGEEVLTFPIVPKEIPEICDEWTHDVIEGYSHSMTVIGRRGRKSLTLELLLPVDGFGKGRYRNIDSAAVSGEKYIEFWQKWGEKKVPMRLVISRGSETLLNIAYVVDSLKWNYSKIQDIEATVEISEYIFEEDPTEEEEETVYSYSVVKLSYGGKSFTVRGILVNGSYLVPVREVLETCGYTVEYDAGEKAIYWKKGSSKTLYTAEFKLIDSVSYSYVREMAKAVGMSVEWDADSKTFVLED